MPRGFGKPQPPKAKKSKFQIKSYSFLFHTSDGSLNVLDIEAKCLQEAVDRFNRFAENLELYLRNPANKELELFLKKRSVGASKNGGEA